MKYYIPFTYGRYGKICIEADNPKEAVDKAKTELSVISEIDLNRISAYLADSLEIDKDGVILDECGNIVGVI
jgi:hypothetical protein|nr:MAG TPA: Protein of unknown function (DUF3659) [Caudoviricetes sp.]